VLIFAVHRTWSPAGISGGDLSAVCDPYLPFIRPHQPCGFIIAQRPKLQTFFTMLQGSNITTDEFNLTGNPCLFSFFGPQLYSFFGPHLSGTTVLLKILWWKTLACDRGPSTVFATGPDMPQSGGHAIYKLSGSRLRLPFPRWVSCTGYDLRSVVWHVEQSAVWPLGFSLLREWVWADSSLKPSTQACLSYPSQRSRYPTGISSSRS
jgi:hypothetical protein